MAPLRALSGLARSRARLRASGVFLSLTLALAVRVTQRRSLRFDWSEGQVNTLTMQTTALLNRLEADTEVSAFFARSEIPDVTGLLDLYENGSDRFQVQYIDPNSAPLLIEEWGLDPEALARGLRSSSVRKQELFYKRQKALKERL